MSINFYNAAAMQPQYFNKYLSRCLYASVELVHCDKTIAISGNILIA